MSGGSGEFWQLRSVHTDTPPLPDLPARLCRPQIVWRASPASSRERPWPAAGALEHPPNGPNPSWCSYFANPGTLQVAIRCRPGGQRSKQPTNAVLCQAYPIYPHVTLGRRRPANLRRPNHRVSISLDDCLLSIISSLTFLATPGPSTLGLLLASFPSCPYPLLRLCARPAECRISNQTSTFTSSTPRDRTRPLAPGILLKHVDEQPLVLEYNIHTPVVLSPVSPLGPHFPQPQTRPGPSSPTRFHLDGAPTPLLAMSSRPQMGVPQRQPPSRSLSGSSSLSQRPAHQRTLSSQYIPSSPIRNNNASSTSSNNNITADFAADPSSQNSNATQTQYGTPRRGGSRLRLELSNQGITHSGFIESPTSAGPLDPFKSFASSRPAAPSMSGDVSDLGDMSSPQTSRGAPTADNDNNPLPMPRRRTRFVVPDARKDVAAPAPAPVKKDIRPKPYTVEVPPAAPRYLVLNGSGKADISRIGSTNAPPTAYADFNPWTGDGPEDHFTQTFIQTGFFDKAPVAQVETSSAKGTIFPSLKHKSGLYALSTVFTGILGSRRHNGQINSASTFKPPPRVTVTDTKREGWLRDLANPTTSLRRLSRTIPHGIRGKGLLEQCLNKNIPTDRAVWLAKCVGANEVRAFKRKGVNGAVVMGGEAKWVRDWTMFVEQFVDGVVSSFEDAEWKTKVNYA